MWDNIEIVDNIENKIESLHLQECFLENRSLWKLVILLETYVEQRH